MATRRPALPVEQHAPGLDAPAVPTARQLAGVERMLEQASHEVTQLARPALDALLPALAQAQRETAQGLAAWLKRVENGDLRYTAQQHRVVLLNLERAFRTIRTLDPTMSAALERMGVQAGRLSVTHLQNEVARLSEIFEGSVRRVPIDVAGVVATGQSFIIPRVRTSAARYAGQVRDDIQRELAVGILRGESISATIDRLVRHGGPRGEVALRGVAGEPGAVTEHIAEGLFRRYRYWAERVVRTETQSAYNTHLDQGFRQAHQLIPDLVRRWDASLDLRVCEICAALHGTTAPIGGTFPDGSTGAPRHPNCRCRVGAWRAEWSEILNPPAPPPPPAAPTVVPATPAAAPKRRRRTQPAPPPDPFRESMRRVAGALRNITPAGGSDLDQALVRNQLRALVQELGLVDRDAMASSANRYQVRPRSRMRGARGLHNTVTGQITVSTPVHNGAKRFATAVATGRAPRANDAHDFRTLLHETVHGHSPMDHSVYIGVGRVIEEVSTELTARRIVRQRFGVTSELLQAPLGPADPSRRSYDQWIVAVRRILEAEGYTARAAIDAMEDASITLRRYAGPVIDRPEEYARKWLEGLPPPDPPNDRLARDARRRRIFDRLKALP